MATFGDRLDELIGRLGMNQTQFTVRLGKTRSNYNYWRSGGGTDFEVIKAIANRWQISLDSLLALPGTDRLAPSPALRRAQENLLHQLAQQDMGGSVEDRVRFLHDEVLSATGMDESAWCEWLQIGSMEETVWTHDALHRAAFIVGWYDEQATWTVWLKTGQADVLSPLSEREIKRYVEYLARSGWTLADIRRKLER